MDIQQHYTTITNHFIFGDKLLRKQKKEKRTKRQGSKKKERKRKKQAKERKHYKCGVCDLMRVNNKHYVMVLTHFSSILQSVLS